MIKSRLREILIPLRPMVRLSLITGLFDAVCAALFALALAGGLQAVWTGQSPWAAVALLVLSLSLRAIISYIHQSINIKIARQAVARTRLGIMEKALGGRGVSPQRLARLNGLFEQTEALEGYYARFYPARMLGAINPLLITVIIAFASPFSALIVLFTLLPFVALMALTGMATAAEAGRQLEALTKLSALFADRLKHLPLIIAFDRQAHETKTVRRAAHEVSERTLNVLRMAFAGSAVLEFFAALSVALIAVYCGFSLLGLLPFHVPEALGFKSGPWGQSAFAAAFFALALAPDIYLPMRRLSAAYHEQQQAEKAMSELMVLEGLLERTASAPLILPQSTSIEFRAVSAFYEDAPVFGPVTFTALPNAITVLTGATGSGKSSLLRLLLGVSGADGLRTEGDILTDHQLLSSANDLSSSLSWMSQYTPILAGTLEDNLRLSYPVASAESLDALIDLTGLRPLVESRSQGLQSLIDERGSGLSGGERRRIGLVRALLKPAPLLLLDEPTADLDPESEADIIKALLKVTSGRTIIIATHSPTLIAVAAQEVKL
ncbi:MAG: ATP-binding cassette domain-containing protein [Asticcacaulis sp.]